MADNTPAEEASDPPGSPPDTQAFPWLLRQKITLPDPVKGHTHRPQLVERAMPTRRRLTVLKAPAGFGKTTLLAECGRRLRQEGVPVAWVSLDERDEPAVLETYIAVACAQAGLNRNASSGKEPANGPDSRMGAMAQETESLGEPFVIAFDQVERLKHPAAFALVAFLLQRGPSNLHLAIACRDIPDGLNLADALLEGRAEVLDTEDLRFSAAETARFFGMRLSRRALAEEMNHSAGWPFALRISLINRDRGAERSQGVAQEFVGNWIESHLLADLGGDDRDFVLDLGLFDWIDSALLDEVLKRAGSARRLESMAVLAGLTEQVRDGATRIWRLHPLLRRHCAQQRLREAPERSDALHRRIATALARRGQIVLAMGHAVEGGDSFLAGALLEQAGGVRLWVRQGVTQLQAAHRLLSEEVIAQSPRLQLLRSAALALSGNPHEARALYRDCAPKVYDGEDADIECLMDDCLVRGCLVLYAGEPVGGDLTQDLSRDMARLGRSSEIDALTRGYLEYAFAVLHFLRGEFEPALERLAFSSDWLAGTQYLAVHGELLRGQIEFMRGRASVAESHLRRSGRIARTHLSLDPVAMTSNRVAAKEMDLECNPTATAAELPGLRTALLNFGVPFSFFATGINVLIDMKLQSATVSQALAVADEVLGHQRRAGLAAFVRLLAALRISLLVREGRIEDADRAYRREALPEAPADCVQLPRSAVWGGWQCEPWLCRSPWNAKPARRRRPSVILRSIWGCSPIPLSRGHWCGNGQYARNWSSGSWRCTPTRSTALLPVRFSRRCAAWTTARTWRSASGNGRCWPCCRAGGSSRSQPLWGSASTACATICASFSPSWAPQTDPSCSKGQRNWASVRKVPDQCPTATSYTFFRALHAPSPLTPPPPPEDSLQQFNWGRASEC